MGRCAVDDELRDGVGGDEQLVEAGAASVAGVAAVGAADAAGELRAGLEDEVLGQVGGVRDGPGLALGADAPDEALGHGSDEGGGDEEGFDAHVHEAHGGGGGVVGVEGGEDEVAGHGGLGGGGGGFEVADFADHDDVGVMAEDGAEALLEGHADLVMDGDLVDALEVVLDGVLDGDDLEFRADDGGEGGIEGGGLAGAGGAGDEEDAVGPVNEALEGAEGSLVHAELLEGEEDVGLVEEAHDDALAEEHGDDGDADVHLAAAHVELDAAVLGDAALRDVQVREDLDAGDDGGLEPVHLGRDGRLLEDAVDAVPDRPCGARRARCGCQRRAR